MSATRAARAGCVFTVGAARERVRLETELRRRLVEIRGCETPRMMNEPRVNFVPGRLERLLGGLDVRVPAACSAA